jgi:hypothetical protein
VLRIANNRTVDNTISTTNTTSDFLHIPLKPNNFLSSLPQAPSLVSSTENVGYDVANVILPCTDLSNNEDPFFNVWGQSESLRPSTQDAAIMTTPAYSTLFPGSTIASLPTSTPSYGSLENVPLDETWGSFSLDNYLTDLNTAKTVIRDDAITSALSFPKIPLSPNAPDSSDDYTTAPPIGKTLITPLSGYQCQKCEKRLRSQISLE